MARWLAFFGLLAIIVGLSTCAYARPVTVPTDAEAQAAHAAGRCGTLGPGPGLNGPRGWVVSMLPGRHEFRLRGGKVGITVAMREAMDFDAGRPYLITIDGDPAALEWRIMGSDWGPVSRYFLYPLNYAPT